MLGKEAEEESMCARKAEITNLGKLKYSVKTGSDKKYRMLEGKKKTEVMTNHTEEK